jgi:hypothetical protein
MMSSYRVLPACWLILTGCIEASEQGPDGGLEDLAKVDCTRNPSHRHCQQPDPNPPEPEEPPPPSLPATCEPLGTPGPLCSAGSRIAPTGTYSDWFWPAVTGGLRSYEWTLNIDFEPPVDGYFWSHQFGFANPGHSAGYVGLQAHGYFAPPTGGFQRTKMALFSVGPGAIAAEPGVPPPDGYAKSGFDTDDGWSIHIKYEWVPCRKYALSVRHLSDESRGQWYGAYVRDTATGVETTIGRMLVPSTWGRLGSQSVMWTERFSGRAMTTCADQEHGSAVFGFPTANGGSVRYSGTGEHFYNPTACPNSRFTHLTSGVRQEMGVPR